MHSASHRLLRILDEAKKVNQAAPYLDGWKIIFKTKETLPTLRKLGCFYQLVDDAAAEVLEVAPDETHSVEHWKSQVVQGLAVSNMRTAWKDFIQGIDVHSYRYLTLHARLVSHSYLEASISDEDLDKAADLLRESIEEIASSQLDPATRINLIRRIRSLLEAIQDYKISGNLAVFDQFKATVFDLAEAKKGNDQFSLTKSLVDALSVIANAMTIATGAQQIAAPVRKLLESLS